MSPLDKALDIDNVEGDGWDKWQKLVLHEIKRLNDCSVTMEVKLDRIEDLVTTNRMKLVGISAILGFIGGLIPLTIGILLKVL
jgi:hypothetical protein